MEKLIPKIEAPVIKCYVMCQICPPVPVKTVDIIVKTVMKLKKLVYNKLGIPKPPDLGYVLPPVPTMEEMKEKFKKV